MRVISEKTRFYHEAWLEIAGVFTFLALHCGYTRGIQLLPWTVLATWSLFPIAVQADISQNHFVCFPSWCKICAYLLCNLVVAHKYTPQWAHLSIRYLKNKYLGLRHLRKVGGEHQKFLIGSSQGEGWQILQAVGKELYNTCQHITCCHLYCYLEGSFSNEKALTSFLVQRSLLLLCEGFASETISDICDNLVTLEFPSYMWTVVVAFPSWWISGLLCLNVWSQKNQMLTKLVLLPCEPLSFLTISASQSQFYLKVFLLVVALTAN